MTDGFTERQGLLCAVEELLAGRRESANAARRTCFVPDHTSEKAYEASLGRYRTALKAMLGWPLTEPLCSPPSATVTQLAGDSLGRIFQVSIPVTGTVKNHGLFFLPKTEGKHPAVIAQHGGQGTPELASGLLPGGASNYNALISGLREHSIAVFAPQLLVWDKGQKPEFDQNLMDRQFRQLGGSRAALDLCQLQCVFNWMLEQPEIDAERIGMAGLSYGGFYSLFFSALEPRIRAVVSSCFVNDRYRYNWEDWVWTGSANRFLDGEVARMICPRPLFLEAGEQDKSFMPDGFAPVVGEIEGAYAALGLSDRLESRIHSGAHEYDPDGKALGFLLNWL